jgi:hypothetical protein
MLHTKQLAVFLTAILQIMGGKPSEEVCNDPALTKSEAHILRAIGQALSQPDAIAGIKKAL